MKSTPIILFADRLPPLIGGMETHAQYFIDHYSKSTRFLLTHLVTLDKRGQNLIKSFFDGKITSNLEMLSNDENENGVIFFNSGRWIEKFNHIRQLFPNKKLVYRTGGNEFLKAALRNQKLKYCKRKSYWTDTINNTIDTIITNSSYTENRLLAIGVNRHFVRCVGGVNYSELLSTPKHTDSKVTLFCAARFVPYKNHLLLIAAAEHLLLKGCNFTIRLAGSGPLLEDVQNLVVKKKLHSIIKFLGDLTNAQVCQEISSSNIYIQLSSDYLTKVPGGSYIHSEGMGRSILEAITAGTFVIAGRSGALEEVITPERGILCTLKSATYLANRIEPYVRSPPRRAAPIEHFSWSNIFFKYDRLFGEEE